MFFSSPHQQAEMGSRHKSSAGTWGHVCQHRAHRNCSSQKLSQLFHTPKAEWCAPCLGPEGPDTSPQNSRCSPVQSFQWLTPALRALTLDLHGCSRMTYLVRTSLTAESTSKGGHLETLGWARYKVMHSWPFPSWSSPEGGMWARSTLSVALLHSRHLSWSLRNLSKLLQEGSIWDRSGVTRCHCDLQSHSTWGREQAEAWCFQYRVPHSHFLQRS